MAHQSEPEYAESLVQSTQPFSDNNKSHNARLAVALGNHDRSTQAFNSQDSAYKARLQATLQQPHVDPNHNPNPGQLSIDAAAHVPAQSHAEAVHAHSQQAPQEEPQPLDAFLAANEGTRLLFLPSDPESFGLKHADVEGCQSPAGEWRDVLWKVDDDESVESLRVLAVSQSVYNVACDATIRGASTTALLTFRVYFNPSSDEVSLLNTSDSTTLVVSGSQPDNPGYQPIRVYQLSTAQIGPGQWDISTPNNGCTTKLLVLPRRFLLPSALAGSSEQPGKKRGTLPATQDPGPKRARGAGLPVSIRTLSAVRNQVVNTVTSHPLIDLRAGQTIELIGSRPEEKYSITRIESLSDSRSSSVWRAMNSILAPDHPSVVAKVLKPTSSVKSAATMFLSETSIHSKLSARGLPTIVQLLGLDARVHSLYLEDIAAPSLAQRAWRGPDDYFSGTPTNARHVLDDMASALAFVHDSGFTHNDIKPGNILFSAARGAVLIDFGLSSDGTRASVAATQTAGTPWYIPPEFRVNPKTGRGRPGDVWALGVVMLYLRCRLPIPDKRPDWQIWAIASHAAAAVERMSAWVERVLAERAQLGLDQMDEAVRGMTEPDPSDRWTIDTVVTALGRSLVLAPEPDGPQEDRPPEAPIREALDKALMDM